MDIINRIVREPAALIGFLTLALAGGSIFGIWELSSQQNEWVLAIIGALVLLMRAYVTPTASPNLPIGTAINEHSDQPTGVVVPKED